MKPLLGWEAGDSVTCSPRQPGGQVGGGLRDPVLIHEMVGLGLFLSSKINGPVLASRFHGTGVSNCVCTELGLS